MGWTKYKLQSVYKIHNTEYSHKICCFYPILSLIEGNVTKVGKFFLIRSNPTIRVNFSQKIGNHDPDSSNQNGLGTLRK